MYVAQLLQRGRAYPCFCDDQPRAHQLQGAISGADAPTRQAPAPRPPCPCKDMSSADVQRKRMLSPSPPAVRLDAGAALRCRGSGGNEVQPPPPARGACEGHERLAPPAT